MTSRALHPQVARLLERAATSPLPPYHAVTPFVARRIYRDTRAALAPKAEEVAETRLLVADGPVALRAYRPAGAGRDEILPALVYYHGGGWTIGDLDTHDTLCRQLANGARCAVFSVDYRMGPEHPFPAAVDDCIAATAWLARSARELRIDPARIAVGGDSAGGNLAAVVALHARDHGGPRLVFQLLIYPATDQRLGQASHRENAEGYLLTRQAIEFFQRCYFAEPRDREDWRASPLLAASLARLPPALVITAGFDPLRDEGNEYAARLKAEGVAVTLRQYDDMVHGFVLFGGVVDAANEAVRECCAALRGAFGQAQRCNRTAQPAPAGRS